MRALKEELLQSIHQLKRHIQARIQAGESVVVFHQLSTASSTQTAVMQTSSQHELLRKLAQTVKKCNQCALAKSRRHVVFGEGDPDARLVFVGEAPGVDEDREGRPFVGAAGKLLTRIIESIGLKREQVYICNVLKCRPPGNRNPAPEEIAACRVYLTKQLNLLKPQLICALGTFAAQTLLNTQESIGRLRGKIYSYESIPVIPTFHPAALLYHPQNKRLVWEDIKKIAKLLGLQIINNRKSS